MRLHALPALLLCLAACRGPGKDAFPGLMQGMDPNGRIPKADLPEDVPNPERWRYLPEGRIVEGSVADRLLISTFAVPIVFFKSDVGAGGGLSLTDIDFRTQRRREFATTTLTYTTEGQQNYSFIWRRWLDQRDLEQGGVLQEERSFVGAFAGYSRTLTRRFFGLGPDSRQEDETSYTEEIGAVAFGYQQSIPESGDDWVVDLGVRGETRSLSGGFVTGVPDTQDTFRGTFTEGDSLASLWIGGGLRYDTRDSQANPYAGHALRGWFNSAPFISGGRSGLAYGADGRAFFEVPPLFHDGGDDREENPPTDVLGVVAQVQDTSGDLPFWALPTLGGSNRLRGFIAGRFTDAAAWFAAAEYRIAIVPRGFEVSERVRVERVGLGLFYELGAVGPGLESIDESKVRDSVGLGLRLGLERQAVFRLDVGFSEDGTNLTILYGLSF